MWQELREELNPRGLEIVTVALDTDGDLALPWIEQAKPTHPSLIDRTHVVGELLGIVNVPSGVWIDEAGTLVRPPETAYPRRPGFLDREVPADATPERAKAIAVTRELRIDAERYVAALRDWVDRGAASPFALAPGEVLRRSRPRTTEAALAATHFELAQHLSHAGRPDAAIPHFQEAQRLVPENWAYKRQAWQLAGADARRLYGTAWLDEVLRIGAENYYPPLEL